MTPEEEQILADRDDLEMMKRPHLWPIPHLLPLKRYRGSDNELAVLLDPAEAVTGNGEVIVALVSIAQFATGVQDFGTSTYPDLEAVVADEWIVD